MIRFFHDKVQLMCFFKYRLGSMLVSAANQSHTCKALLQATAHHGKGTMGVHVGFHVGFQGMREVTMRKVLWGSMLGSMLVSSFQGMGEVTMGKVPWGSMLVSMERPCYIVGG